MTAAGGAPPRRGGPLSVVAALLLDREGRLLIGQRAGHKSHPWQWEFPGGKVEPGEAETDALARELHEELAIRAEIGALAARVRHRYDRGEVEVAFYRVRRYQGRLRNRVFAAIAWAPPATLPSYDFLAADRGLVAQLASGALAL